MAENFTDVSLVAEHVPETHLVDGVHGSGTTQELPGTVNVYLVVDGARILFTSYKASKVFDAIEAAKQDEQQGSQQAPSPDASTASTDPAAFQSGQVPAGQQQQ